MIFIFSIIFTLNSQESKINRSCSKSFHRRLICFFTLSHTHTLFSCETNKNEGKKQVFVARQRRVNMLCCFQCINILFCLSFFLGQKFLLLFFTEKKTKDTARLQTTMTENNNMNNMKIRLCEHIKKKKEKMYDKLRFIAKQIMMDTCGVA